MLKAIIFDFDGVICESISVKRDAFAKLFEDYPEQVDEIVEYHMRNGGMSRYKKFDYIYKEILKKDLTEEQSKELGEQFTAHGLDGVMKAEFVKGALEFLQKYYEKLHLFIASGTPHEEMQQIVDERQLRKYFKGVFGSPKSKGDIILNILEEHELNNDEILFVGDAINDLNGALAAKIRFVGRVHESFDNPFEDLDERDLVNDISHLESKLLKEGLLN